MGIDLQSKFRLALGSVKDRASIGKAMIHNHDRFSDIEIAVVRATGHDNSAVDDKYTHEILFLVSNSPRFIPFLTERLSRRLAKTSNRLVALKTLVLIHRLLRSGNRCFEQQLRSAHVSGHLRMGTQHFSGPSFRFLHKYAAYLEERMDWLINQAGKLEPITSQGLEFRFHEGKSIDMVFSRSLKCQVFLDRVLGCSPIDILPSDNLAQAAMINTLKESFQVYMTFCEGVAALVHMLFDLTKRTRSLAFDILKKASQQSQELCYFYENCRRNIRNKNLEYPFVQIITTDHIMALQQVLTCTPLGSRESKLTSSDSPPPVLDCLKKSAEMESILKSKEGEKNEKRSDNSLSSTLFSCTLETKISKVWVAFDEDEPEESLFSVGRLFSGRVSDLPLQQTLLDPRSIFDPLTCVDLSLVSKV